MKVTYKDGVMAKVTGQNCPICGEFTEHIVQVENDIWAECTACHEKAASEYVPINHWKYIIGDILQAIVYIAFLVCILLWPLVLIAGYLILSYILVGYWIIASQGFGWRDGFHVWFYAPCYLPLMMMCAPLI